MHHRKVVNSEGQGFRDAFNAEKSQGMGLVLPFYKAAVTHLGENWDGVGMRLNIPPTPKHSMAPCGRDIALPLDWDAAGKGDALPRQEFPPCVSQSLGSAVVKPQPSGARGILGTGLAVRGSEG